MHELSICRSIVDAAAGEVRKLNQPGARLVRAKVAVGALRQIVPEYLAFAYETLVAGTVLEGSVLDVVKLPLHAGCPECGWNGVLPERLYECPGCGSGGVEIEGGMELYLESLEVEE